MGGYDTPRRLANGPFLISTSTPGAVVPRRLDAGHLQTADKPLAAESVGFEKGGAVFVEQEPSHPQLFWIGGQWVSLNKYTQVISKPYGTTSTVLSTIPTGLRGAYGQARLDGHQAATAGGRLMR